MAFTRRHLLGVAVTEVVLFVLAGVTSKSSKHPGTVSNIFWSIFLIGVVVLLVLVIYTLFRSRRRPTG